MNVALLTGNLGRDPEIRYTQNGKAVANFSVATKEYGNKTEWHNVVVWEKTAERCAEYLNKGSKVAVIGRLQTRSWEKDSHTFYKTEIVATNVEFLSPKEEAVPENYRKAEQPKVSGGENDNIPF